jgi:hypothetical protein
LRSAAAQGGGLVFTPTRLPGEACRPDGSSGSGSAVNDRGHSKPATDDPCPSEPGAAAARRSPRPRSGAVTPAQTRAPGAHELIARREAPGQRDAPQARDPLLEVEADLESQDRDLLLSGSSSGRLEALDPERQARRDPETLALAVERLEEVGVYPGLSQRIAQLAWVTPELIEAWIARLSRQRQVRHLAALLVAVLRDPTRCFPAPPLPAGSPAPEDALGEADGDWPDQDGSALSDGEGDSRVDAASARTVNLPFAWDDWLLALRARLGQQSVDTWLADAQPVSWADGVLVVALPSAMGVDWLTRCYGRELDLAAREVAGGPVNVRLVTARGPRR